MVNYEYPISIVSIAVMLIPGQQILWKNPIIPATAAGVIGYIIVSLSTSPNKFTFEEMTEILFHERQWKMRSLKMQVVCLNGTANSPNKFTPNRVS